MTLHGVHDLTRQARRLVADVFDQACLNKHEYDAATVATELVTNALLHGRPPAELVVRAEVGGPATVEVFDSGHGLPLHAGSGPEAMTGRGLRLVATLTKRWGVRQAANGKVVWAELGRGTETVVDASPDEILAAWADVDEEPGTSRTGDRFAVHLGDVPTALLLEAKAHVDNVVREFALAGRGARDGTTSDVSPHLAELIDAVVDRFAEPRNAIKRQALTAAYAGEDHVRLVLHLPLSAADAGEAYLRALDGADAYCRAERLLTLESTPQHRIFRRWYVGELVSQLRHAAAGKQPPPPQTFEQRLLAEIDHLAAAERRSEHNARLYELASALISARTPAAVTQAVLTEGVQALRADGGAVLLSSSSPHLDVPGTLGYGRHVVAQLRAETADVNLPAAVALRSGEAVWLESRAERDARFPALAGMEPTTVSMCAVPVVAGERRLGALRFSFTQPRLFDEGERAFVLAMAALTARALDRPPHDDP